MSTVRRMVLVTSCALAASFSMPVFAQTYTATDRQPTPAELANLPAVTRSKVETLMKEIRVPDGFQATIFATPPAVNYPVFVAAAPDGTLYVSSDGNGSLDRKPHMGRVLRVRDTNGDGEADEVKAFVPDVDSPRGLVWDHDRLYLLHPPNISVYVDTDGDGVVDEEKTLVTGIAFTFKDRPADHSSNGLELGVDGWLYAAIGDFGFMEATGTDGRKLQLRGGGVVRVRPDGTGLELFANGTRNILEVAVSPLLDAFARDNTNDGGGWDVRFHHFSGLTEHGYPKLFKNFGDEIIQPLADFGGGAGCGAAWIDEPGIPAKWNNAPFTADWGREWIYHHQLKPNGATFMAGQDEFVRLPRVTDLDVDAHSAIYAASWKGASFTWVGPDVGFIARLTPKGYQSPVLPDFARATDEELVGQLGSPSHRRRLAAQRVLIRRAQTEHRPELSTLLNRLASQGAAPLASRVAAVFALSQGFGTAAGEAIARLISDPSLAAWAVRASADHGDIGVPTAVVLRQVTSPDPRVRREAVVALTRLNSVANAPALVALLADTDSIVRHTVVQVLIRLRAADVCSAVIDDPEAGELRRMGALQVVQSLAEPRVVDRLLASLAGEKDPGRRRGLLTALCRLHFQEGVWKGDSWGTRPDTRGPFYQPEPWSETPRIGAALKAALAAADATEAAHIGRELARHRIPAGEAIEQLIARAATESTLLPALALQLANAETVPSSAVPFLVRTATAGDTTDAVRAQAVIALAKTDDAAAWRAVLQALPIVRRTSTENNLSEKATAAVNNAPRLDLIHAVLEEVAPKLDGEASLLAETLLVKLAARKVGAPEARAAANRSLDEGWQQPRRRAQILRAAAQAGDTSRAAQFVAALDDTDAEVVRAARETVKRLKLDPAKIKAAADAPKVGSLGVEATLSALSSARGEVGRGEQLFAQSGCNGCHTVKADEPLKGPFLGTVATVYRPRELAEAILLPNKTIAQGFVANHFELKDGSEVDGFVVREAADVVTIRTITALEMAIPVRDIVRREKQERSLMPEGLVNGLTVTEFASLLSYLQSLADVKAVKP